MLATNDPLLETLKAHPTWPKFSKLENWQAGQPLPNDVGLDALNALVTFTAESLLTGAEDKNADTLKRLFERYPKWESPTDGGAFWNDWLDDVRDWPASLLAEACTRWRNSSAKRAPDTAGQLRAAIARQWEARRSLREKAVAARKQFAATSSPAPQTIATAHDAGPWTQFCGEIVRRFGKARGAYILHALALKDGVLWTGTRILSESLPRDAGDILDAFGFTVEFFPDRYNRLTSTRPPLAEVEITPEQRRQMADGLRRHAEGLRRSMTETAKPKRRLSQDDRAEHMREMKDAEQ